jgi:L-ascorbate metabolism protein UlaG (beta-lactamase superfamily)
MEITYLGHSSFKLRGKQVTVVTDPFGDIGIKFPKHTSSDVVTISHDHDDHNQVSAIEGNPFIIKGPGEYEVKGVGIVGVSVFHDDEKGAKRGKNTIYRIELDGLSIVHLGDLGHALASQQVDELDGVNILLVPVGGVYTIDASQAAEVVAAVEPSIVIPMHYHTTSIDQKIFGSLAPVSAFLKEMGKVGTTPVPKLSITKDKLPEELQVVILS